MTKKRIIISVLIILLLVAGIGVNIVALKLKENKNQGTDNSTNIAENVEKSSAKNEVKKENVITEEDLELNGKPYEIADVQDKDGNTITLERQEDMPMVILFWNNVEESGLEALKILQNQYDKYSEKIIFSSVAVVNKEEIESIEKKLADNGITISNAYDIEESASKANNVTKFPTIVAINKDGEVINTVSDEISEDIIEANLDIIAENY